ncbi:TonB-dependent receptor [Vibrio sp. MM46]|uniref:TonB-dependent receptor domain-containing protein n=1 Tax=Vibrio sp. MM46 TaxID=2998835 RepID=UPI0022CD86BC|nr:TonB-dependent receptor [Vibrio sp. MM46]MDA0122711.1 TonB-dependent receptor [Vibrio sp. MM46]
MKRLSTHGFKVSLVSLAVLNSLASYAAEGSDEELEVIGVHYAKPITVAEPAQTTIDWSLIEEQQYSNFADMIDSVPGATLDGGARSGGERINIRGFDDPSDIAVFVDGAPIGFQQYRYGTFFFDPFLIGEAEIIKGAHDYRALNGKFGGSIRIKTKSVDDLLDGDRNFGARVSTGYNNNGDENSYTLSLYGKNDAGFYFLANGSVKDSDDIQVGGGETLDYSGYEQENMLVKVGYENDDHEFEISHTRYKDEGRKPWANRRGKMPNISDYNIKKYGSLEKAKYAYTVDNKYTDNTTTLSYHYMPSNPYIDFNIKMARSENDRHWVRPDVAFEKMFVSVGSYGHESWLSYERDYVDVFNQAQIGDHALVTGLQYQKTDRDSLVFNKSYAKKEAKNYGWYTPYYEPSGIQTIYAAYVADHYQATDRLTITPSLRYEYITSEGKGNAAPDYNDPAAGHDYSETSHKGFSPRLDIDFDATNNTRLNFSYAYALKAPTVDNIYSVQYARATATARDLDVSRIHAYQASVINLTEGLVSDRDNLATEFTVFYNDVNDTVDIRTGANLDKNSTENQSWNTNLDGFKNYGFELISQYRISDFYTDFSASYVRGKNKGSLSDSTGSDDDHPDVPPLNINLGFGYEWLPGLRSGWEVRWYDAQTKTKAEGNNLKVKSPSEQYTLQNAYVVWDVQQVKGLSVGAVVKNLTDRYYEAYLSNGVPSPGREVKLKLTYQY